MGCFWSSGLSDEKEEDHCYVHLKREEPVTPDANFNAPSPKPPEDFQRVRYNSFVGYREKVAEITHLSNDSIGTLRSQEEKIADDYSNLHNKTEENSSGTLSYSPPSKRQRTSEINLVV